MTEVDAFQESEETHTQHCNQESMEMTFKNEKISEQDRVWISAIVNYGNIRKISRWIHEFDKPYPTYWTADRERKAYLMMLGGGGSPDDEGRLPYAVLVLDGEVVVFNLTKMGQGTLQSGLSYEYLVRNLEIPSTLIDRSSEVRDLIEQAIREYSFFDPFANGGTFVNPNLTARKNVLSCNVDFQ